MRPYLMLPADSLVESIAKELSKETKASVHIQILDSQWFLGGPKKKFATGIGLGNPRRQK